MIQKMTKPQFQSHPPPLLDMLPSHPEPRCRRPVSIHPQNIDADTVVSSFREIVATPEWI
jgi:hypothetical protein